MEFISTSSACRLILSPTHHRIHRRLSSCSLAIWLPIVNLRDALFPRFAQKVPIAPLDRIRMHFSDLATSHVFVPRALCVLYSFGICSLKCFVRLRYRGLVSCFLTLALYSTVRNVTLYTFLSNRYPTRQRTEFAQCVYFSLLATSSYCSSLFLFCSPTIFLACFCRLLSLLVSVCPLSAPCLFFFLDAVMGSSGLLLFCDLSISCSFFFYTEGSLCISLQSYFLFNLFLACLTAFSHFSFLHVVTCCLRCSI